MEIYFENTPNIGNLHLEHIFYEYGEPILFVCCGSNNRRYLCSCCKLSERWILSQVSEEELIQLIDNSISIRSLFESRTHSLFMVSWDGISLSTEFDNIMPELLPDAKPLELPKKETNKYREFLLDQLGSKGNSKDIIVHHSEILDPQIYMDWETNMSNFIPKIHMDNGLRFSDEEPNYKTGKRKTPNCKEIYYDGEIFQSVTECANYLKISTTTLKDWLKGNKPVRKDKWYIIEGKELRYADELESKVTKMDYSKQISHMGDKRFYNKED